MDTITEPAIAAAQTKTPAQGERVSLHSYQKKNLIGKSSLISILHEFLMPAQTKTLTD